MKTYRHILYIVTGLLALSCAKEPVVDNQGQQEQQNLVINAFMAEEDPSTKTSMGPLEGSIYKVLWSAGDKLAIGKGSNFKEFTIGNGVGSKTATFTGSKPQSITSSGYFAASYPFSDASASLNGDVITIGNIIPSNQTYTTDTFATDSYPMVSVSTDGIDYQMRNLAGVIQIPVIGPGKIRSFQFIGNNNEQVAGEISMSFSSETGAPVVSTLETDFGCKLTMGSQTSKRITVSSAEGITLKADEPTMFNIIVAPQVFEKGFTLLFTDDNGGRFKVQGYFPQTVKRSWTLRMKDVLYKTPEPLETANAYIINEPGYNYFPAFCMGNRQECTFDTAGRNLAADILWSDCGMDAITDVEYFTTKDGKGSISFELQKDPSTGKAYRGNVVVCLYDTDTKEILWSWHLWLTETPKEVITGGLCANGTYTTNIPNADGTSTAVTFTSEAAKGHLIIMDRNLGAISADPADGWKTYGLYYQMGRKDPFIGGQSEGSPTDRSNLTVKNEVFGDENFVTVQKWESEPFSASFTKPTEWNLYLTDGWKMNFPWINLTQSIREPMTMSSYNKITSVLWTDYSSADNMSYMDPNLDKGSTNGYGHTGLQHDGHEAYWNRTKTIFDPCPAGYTLLGERNGVFFGKDTFTATNAAPAYGITSHFTYDGVTYDVWWPAAGMRSSNGIMIDVGYTGSYFFFDHINNTHGGHGLAFHINGTGYVFDIDQTKPVTNHASSIRCVKAKQS